MMYSGILRDGGQEVTRRYEDFTRGFHCLICFNIKGNFAEGKYYCRK